VTTITFHFNVSDPADYVGRLSRKAVAAAARTVVLADPDMLERIDHELWLTTATDFLPHCREDANQRVLMRSPLVLRSSLQGVSPADVLINLLDALPDGFEAFDRVIEVVGMDEPQRNAARQRWRHYTAAGLELARFDAQGR